MCVEGAARLYAYCEERGIRVDRCGKVIVALHDGELERLDELERRGRANGVPGLRRLRAEEIRELEPHCTGIAGLHSPNTGIVDFGAVARALADDVRAAGDGALRTCIVPAASETTKSSTSAPSRPTAWARTPAGPPSTSRARSSGT